MTRILFLISFLLLAPCHSFATETVSENPVGGERIKDFKSNESLNTINEELRILRDMIDDLNKRLKAGGL